MKTLKEHNADIIKRYNALQKLNEPHPNGIACPVCGNELWDSCPTMILASNPPKLNINCPNCNYTGYRLK